jgi:nitrile hydratase accessory protein
MEPGSDSAARDASLPVGSDDAAFAEPWEAKAFAIVVKLTEAGHFTWSEWVAYFSKEVAAATAAEQAGERPKTYYEQWLDAAERIMIDKGVTSKEQLLAKGFAIGAAGPAHVLK